MAFSINACIKLSSSPSPPLPNPSPPSSSHWPSRSREMVWRRSTLTAAAAAIVTIGAAAAIEEPVVLPADAGDAAAVPAAERWSDKRKCPPWHANSLENIMPENLPRPLARRSYDGFAAYGDAPALVGGALAHRHGRDCYLL
ncbi:uncharacterized protein LOC110028560 [Phalaenopsis equestris]|uniref:Uncharacterized protein n=1 Tax=Phalaenopsis equestris TaxID=78828 RepID=A0A1S6YG08_PHAEQ|nr:uncharacterized protein LOC110028560 [Phalaenopsis equestris]XP_020586120.1 uncharacterized protein LOC110028560 [Phalaenopsis equestris]AQX44211.1 hypothetical protein [Phalaenopsis equestris]